MTHPFADASRVLRVVLAALITGACLAGCGSSPPKPAQVEGRIETTASVNPSVSNRPSPVLIRVYELKTATSFNAADFISLYERDQATLGADLVAREEMMLKPGESRPLKKTLGADTRFVGVFAAFRDLERSSWRSVAAIQPGKKQQVVVRADGLAITVTAAKK